MRNIALPNGRLKYDAACIDGKYTGFIPCSKCAEKIMKGEIKVQDLIKNRWFLFEPFPNHGNPEILNQILHNEKD